MFNFDAETFVIVYPFAAGGRFLQMAMSLDNSVVPIHTHTHVRPPPDRLFEEYKQHLKKAPSDAHYNQSGHLPQYIPSELMHAERYVLCLHQVEIELALEFLRRCQNLKAFFIETSTEESFRLLRNRRWNFAQKVTLPMQDSYKLHPRELLKIQSVNQTFKLRTGHWPVGSIELADYWSPTKAILLLNDFFKTHNINPTNWENLYYIWIDNVIRPAIANAPSNS